MTLWHTQTDVLQTTWIERLRKISAESHRIHFAIVRDSCVRHRLEFSSFRHNGVPIHVTQSARSFHCCRCFRFNVNQNKYHVRYPCLVFTLRSNICKKKLAVPNTKSFNCKLSVRNAKYSVWCAVARVFTSKLILSNSTVHTLLCNLIWIQRVFALFKFFLRPLQTAYSDCRWRARF